MRYKKPESYIENKGDVLASKAYHIMFPEGRESIGIDGIKEINNKQWEIFWIHKETKDAYYGTPAIGLGLMDCMILKKDSRNRIFRKEVLFIRKKSTKNKNRTYKVKMEHGGIRWENYYVEI